MTYWTKYRKPEVIEALDQVGVEGEARKTILKFERHVSTCINRLSEGMSWAGVMNLTPALRAMEAMELLSGNVTSWREKPLFWDEWVAYCETRGWCPDTTLSDHLS